MNRVTAAACRATHGRTSARRCVLGHMGVFGRGERIWGAAAAAAFSDFPPQDADGRHLVDIPGIGDVLLQAVDGLRLGQPQDLFVIPHEEMDFAGMPALETRQKRFLIQLAPHPPLIIRMRPNTRGKLAGFDFPASAMGRQFNP